MNRKAVLMRRLVILGIVSLVFVAGCGGGPGQPLTNQPPLHPPSSQPTAVTVWPSSARVQPRGVHQFAVTVTPSGASQAVTWSVSGTGCTGATCGSVDASGKYTAPATAPDPPTVTVTGTSMADSNKFGLATVTVTPLPATLLIEATPPVGVTVLSFSATMTGAVLQPGDIALVTNPVSVEINRLQVETSLLANLPIPSGTYTGLTVTFANPVLTILNNSGAADGSCASGAICKLTPALAVSSVNLTGQPFPVTFDGSAPFALLLDFDLSRSLSSFATINPVVMIRQLTSAKPEGVRVKQVLGKIVNGGGDVWDGAIFDMVTDVGTITEIDDNFGYAHYVDGDGYCGHSFFCLDTQTVEADLRVPRVPFWLADRITVKSSDQTELEGAIVNINSDRQFDIVLLHQVPAVVGLEIGDVVRISLQSDATVEAVDIDPRRSGLLFSTPSDLSVGQVVTARARSAPSGTPLAVTTDRVRLKSGAFTARVKSIRNSTDFVVDNLPGNFSSAEIQLRTNSQTNFLAITGVGALKAGDIVSLSGFLLKDAGDSVLLAEGVRKR